MNGEARRAGVPVHRIHLVVAIDRFLARLLDAAPHGSWVVKGGHANQLRRPDEARSTEDLDLRIEAAIEEATGLLAAGFAIDLGDDFGYEAAAAAAPLLGRPGGGLRFVVVVRVAGYPLVRFKVDVSAADVIVGGLEAHLSDPVLERLGFTRARYPVYPIAQHVAEPETSLISRGSVRTSPSALTLSSTPALPHSNTGRRTAGHPPCPRRRRIGGGRTSDGEPSWTCLTRPLRKRSHQ